MIHIVFSEQDALTLQAAMNLDDNLNGKIITCFDNFSIGPINNIYFNEGIEARKEWWKDILMGGDFSNWIDKEKTNSVAAIEEAISALSTNDEEIIWIWAAQNARDVSGYYWMLHYLKPFQGRVFILYLNNLPFINEKGGIFYPVELSEIMPREFLKAKKLARPITLSEFELDPDEWQKFMNDPKGIRLLEGGKKLTQVDYDYFDNTLKKHITGQYTKASKIMNQFFQKREIAIGEAFLLWRIKELVNSNTIQAQGKMAGMKDFEIKTPVKETVAEDENE